MEIFENSKCETHLTVDTAVSQTERSLIADQTQGREKERIDLTTLGYDEITAMMEEKGFKTHDEL